MSFSVRGFSPPRIIAHRGASAIYPENTLVAFDAAVTAGCDGIELDLQLSRDGVPVVYHDRTLRKIGGGTRKVGQLDWRAIERLDAGGWRDPRHAGERVPSLDCVLERYARQTCLLLELKVRPYDKRADSHVALVEAVLQRLRRRGINSQVMVLCFDLETLELVTRLAADIPTVLNLNAPRRITRALRDAVGKVSALSIDVRTLSVGVVSAVHAAGKPVLTYTCNGPQIVRRALTAGVDGLMTDRPDWLRHTLARVVGSEPPGSADAA